MDKNLSRFTIGDFIRMKPAVRTPYPKNIWTPVLREMHQVIRIDAKFLYPLFLAFQYYSSDKSLSDNWVNLFALPRLTPYPETIQPTQV